MCRCRISPEHYKEKTRKRYIAQRPQPLPKRRARDALSPPPTEFRVIKRPRTCKSSQQDLHLPLPQSTQDESLLLRMLPAEIRLQIWTEVVANKEIHILRKMGKVGHSICTGLSCPHHPGSRTTTSPPQPYEPFPKDVALADSSLLPLLRTCRQIYAESISLLYTHNTFLFPHPWNLDFLRMTILPTRFSAIRTVQLTHRFDPQDYENAPPPQTGRYAPLVSHPTPKEDWDSAVENITAMKSLRSLVVRVARAPRWRGTSIHGVQAPFAALGGVVKRLEKFEVVVEKGAVDARLMQRGLEEKGVVCRVVEEVPVQVDVPQLVPQPMPQVSGQQILGLASWVVVNH